MHSIFLLFHLLLNNQQAPFCSCRDVSVKQNFTSAAIVLKGIVLKVDTVKIYDSTLPRDSYYENHLATIRINHIYKADTSSLKTIQIITGAGYGDCGYNFKLNKEYLIYANKKRPFTVIDSIDLTNRDPIVSTKHYYETSICHRTTENFKNEQVLINKYLKEKND